MKRLGTALAAALAAVGIAIAVQPTMPAYERGRRTSHLTILVDAATATEAWPAWAIAWCPDGDAECVDANNDDQGVPMCVGDAVAGYIAKTRATPSQAARAAFMLDGVAVVVDGDASAAIAATGWTTCPDLDQE